MLVEECQEPESPKGEGTGDGATDDTPDGPTDDTLDASTDKACDEGAHVEGDVDW